MRTVVLGAGYARLFIQLKDQRVDKLSKFDADLLISRLTSAENLQELTLNRSRAPDGTVTEQWQINSPKDLKLNRQLMELEALADVAAPPRPLPGLARGTPAHPLRAASARPAPPAIESMTLGAARGAFLATLKPSTLPNQGKRFRRANPCDTFCRHYWDFLSCSSSCDFIDFRLV